MEMNYTYGLVDDCNGTANDICNNQGNEVDDCHGWIANFKPINVALFIVIFISSVAGNLLILWVLIFCETMKKVTNLFALNLACSDLMFAFTLPFYAYYEHSHWVFGNFWCKFLTGIYFTSVYTNIMLLTTMSVDRFVTVVVQKQHQRSTIKRQRFAMGTCVCAWIISIAASVSDAIKSNVEIHGEDIYCEDSTTSLVVGYYLQVALLFFLPFAVIVFCYSAILRMVLRGVNRNNRTVFFVFYIILAFFVCWAPHNMLIFVLTLYTPQSCNEKRNFFLSIDICRLLAYCHCCMNPVLYMLTQKFRKHVLHVFHRKNIKREDRESENIQCSRLTLMLRM